MQRVGGTWFHNIYDEMVKVNKYSKNYAGTKGILALTLLQIPNIMKRSKINNLFCSNVVKSIYIYVVLNQNSVFISSNKK